MLMQSCVRRRRSVPQVESLLERIPPTMQLWPVLMEMVVVVSCSR
jgi:hypothetical protein